MNDEVKAVAPHSAFSVLTSSFSSPVVFAAKSLSVSAGFRAVRAALHSQEIVESRRQLTVTQFFRIAPVDEFHCIEVESIVINLRGDDGSGDGGRRTRQGRW